MEGLVNVENLIKTKKPFYKKSWVWVIVVFVVFVFIATYDVDSNETEKEVEVVSQKTPEQKGEIEAKEVVTGVTIEEYEKRISQALKEMGDKTNLKIISSDVQEDGKTVITLSENVMIFIETNKEDNIDQISMGVMPDTFFTDKEDFHFSFLLLVGTADDSLSMGDRNLVIRELGLDDEVNLTKERTAVYRNNDIAYTFNGSIKDNFILQAEYK